MIKFLKKHQCCLSFLSIVLAIFAYFYLSYFRYEPDRYDDRNYPLPPLTEKWSITIEYKALPHVKFSKCFILSFNEKQLENNVNKTLGKNFVNKIFKFKEHTMVTTYYDEVYTKKYSLYHTEDLADKEFYQESKEKPHFWLKIYKDNILLETRELYFTNFESRDIIKTGNREFYVMGIISRPGHKQGYCHDFTDDTQYKLEIINDTVVPEFEDVDVFFTIKPITPKV